MQSKKCLNLIAPHLGSTVGRVVYHSMAAAAAGAAVDVSAVFAMTLAAYQQQQQRSMAVWNLIMDGYDDDTELDAENDESTREIIRRRVYQRKDYKTSGWWQELQDEDLSGHTSRAAWRFRGDFRVPYYFFEELVVLVKQERLMLVKTKMILRTIYNSNFCRLLSYKKYTNTNKLFTAHNVFQRKIRTHLDLLSIPQSGGKNVKTFRWDHRLQIQNLFMAFKRVPLW